MNQALKKKGYFNKRKFAENNRPDDDKGVLKSLVRFNKIMKIVAKLLGYTRYLMLLRLLKHFSRYESQIFLIDEKYEKSDHQCEKQSYTGIQYRKLGYTLQ